MRTKINGPNNSHPISLAGADLGGGRRGCPPPPHRSRDDLRFSNTTGILPPKKNYVVYWCWSRAIDECIPSYKKSWIRPYLGCRHTKGYSLLLNIMTCQWIPEIHIIKQMVILRGIIKFSTSTPKKHDLTEKNLITFGVDVEKSPQPPPAPRPSKKKCRRVCIYKRFFSLYIVLRATSFTGIMRILFSMLLSVLIVFGTLGDKLACLKFTISMADPTWPPKSSAIGSYNTWV